MIKNNISNLIRQKAKSLAKAQQWRLPKNFDVPLNTCINRQYGDYSTTIALIFAKNLKSSPLDIPKLLLREITKKKIKDIQKIEIAEPGYINFFLEPQAFQRELKSLSKINLKDKKISKKPVIIDYSSPNIAKPMHIGHLRSTIIGDSLANLYETLGYKVIRWNYVGDWGTQFGKLITAYKLWGNKKHIEKDPLKTLLALYQKFHRQVKINPGLEQTAQKEFKKLEQGDKENRRLWFWFKKESLKNFQKLYKLLGIKFDITKGESEMKNFLSPLIETLKKKGIIQKSEGALIANLEDFHLPPALIQKSDEATLYLTRDLAALIYRIKKYHPVKILYLVGNEQDLHFKQLFALAKILGLIPKTEAEHIKFGLILGENKKKFSTRKGELITLEEVIQEALDKSLTIIKEKHPRWTAVKQNKSAQVIALGALKFNDLKSFRGADIVFNWEKMLGYKGDSSVYLQYTYARLNKILLKAKKIGNFDPKLLSHPSEIALIKKLIDFSEAVKNSAYSYSPNILANYLLSLADLANNYYEKVPVLKETNQKRRNAQLLLIKIIVLILKKGLEILGIEVLKEI